MNNKDFWDIAFIQLYGWTMHPGYTKANTPPPTMGECALLADHMLKLRRLRWQHGSEEHSSPEESSATYSEHQDKNQPTQQT